MSVNRPEKFQHILNQEQNWCGIPPFQVTVTASHFQNSEEVNLRSPARGGSTIVIRFWGANMLIKEGTISSAFPQ